MRGSAWESSFLRHIERTALLLHIIDISRDETSTGWHDFEVINSETGLIQSRADSQTPDRGRQQDRPAHTREKLKDALRIFAEKGIVLYPFSAAKAKVSRPCCIKLEKALKNIRYRQTEHE
jgi:GTP-binding protein